MNLDVNVSDIRLQNKDILTAAIREPETKIK